MGWPLEWKNSGSTRCISLINSSIFDGQLPWKSGGSGLWTLACASDIYLGEYSGWYSVSDEEFFTESQLAERYSVMRMADIWLDENYRIAVEWSPKNLASFASAYTKTVWLNFQVPTWFHHARRPSQWNVGKLHRARFGKIWRYLGGLAYLGVLVPSNPKHVIFICMDWCPSQLRDSFAWYGQEDHENFW